MNIQNLYRQVIMEHYKYPKNKGLTNDPKYKQIQLHNPSCGDDVKIELLIENGKIKDIRHDGVGCSICCSSASVASDALIGLRLKEAKEYIDNYLNMIMGQEYDKNVLKGDALAYQGVTNFPARIRCATLAWKAIEKGIDQEV